MLVMAGNVLVSILKNKGFLLFLALTRNTWAMFIVHLAPGKDSDHPYGILPFKNIESLDGGYWKNYFFPLSLIVLRRVRSQVSSQSNLRKPY